MVTTTTRRILFVLAIIGLLSACVGGGGGGGGDNDNNSDTSSDKRANSSNQARFFFDCDLQGLNAEMIMDVEVISSSGITWGSGPNPDITGVISTGDYIIYTSGSLQSSTAAYIFTGENQFADFTEQSTFERFRVQWVEQSNGLTMIVNPFGQGPAQHFCELTGSERL